MADGVNPRLGGRYELLDVLGYGGMAEVRRGHDVRLGRDVAVKTLRPDLARDPSFQARFRREAQSAASLNHPTVVAIYDTGEESVGEDATPYIVMEYVDGRTLRDVLRSEGRLLPNRAFEITGEVLRALEYSHRAGIVHRDIKPANVMLTKAGDVKVMDFGISRALSDVTTTMTQTAAVVGTAQYLSPEQARGEHVDHRSDIYSAGCLLYELLTGQPPFTGDSPVAVAYQHVREDPVPPSQLVADLPAGADAVVLKAMAKNPANRYQSAVEMREDVERVIAGQPVRATPVLGGGVSATTVLSRTPPASEGDRTRQRTFAYIALAAGVVVVFLLAAFVVRSVVSGPGGGAVRTPSLLGLTRNEAAARLDQVGLKLGEVGQAYSPTIPTGRVTGQEPLPEISVRRGDSIAITLSKGPAPAKVPDIIGLSEADARAALAKVGIKVGSLDKRDDKAAAGTVLEVTPAPGTAVNAGSSVGLVLASGFNTVPQVTGLPESDARAQLVSAGFKVQRTTVIDPTVVPGTVTSQDPPGSARVKRGATITIVVAQPEPTPTTEPTPTGEPTPSTEPSATPTP
ncbi:MAG: eukaryotic-like serine/threonine-protein kinase [Frankiales bacterium]|jgi:serine/threonine-protein kinase|nr:eukaryotic-like serine/threonine-protein kinase [Frankiales bacterium]MDX6274299.1 eukaryotic-like serine/threonine-protein kinase [Frankiales bacterium]